MNTLVVDDRQLAVNALVYSLKEIDPDGNHTGHISVNDAVLFAGSHKLDVAFLDVEMPEMSGLNLAKILKRLQPAIKVVLVTGHSEYALDAFQTHAVDDYLMKPVDENELLESLKHLELLYSKSQVQIVCFGNFEVFVDGRPAVFRRTKSKELLAFLIDAKGEFCSMGELASALWEDGQYTESRSSQIRTFISDVRKMFEKIGFGDFIIKEHNAVAVLRKAEIKCDYFEYLDGDSSITFSGEYMKQYSWAEYRIPQLRKIGGEV